MCFTQIIQIIHVLLIGVTVFLLCKYTKETTRLRKATVDQNELNLRPFITVERRPGSGISKLDLKNNGKGVAINVSVEKTEVKGISIPNQKIEKETMELEFNTCSNVVAPDKTLELAVKGTSKNKELNKKELRNIGFAFFEYGKYGVNEYEIKIYYENILRQPYITEIIVDCKKKRFYLSKVDKIQKKEVSGDLG